MYNASHYRRPSSFVWTVCKGDRVPEQPPPSHPLTSALGSVLLQTSWMLQGSPAPLKEIVKKKKKKSFFCALWKAPIISLTSFRSYHYSPDPFPCFEDYISLSFHAKCPCCLLLSLVLLLQTCMSCLKGIALFSVHGLVLFPFLCRLKSSACLHGPDCACAYPLVFASLLLFVIGLCFSAADTRSAAEVCVRGISFSRRIAPGNWKTDLRLTFPDVKTWLLEVGPWVVPVGLVIFRDLTAGCEGLILKGLKINRACQNPVSGF